MAYRVALVTNALAFAGPPAIAALSKNGFVVVAHDQQFKQQNTVAIFQNLHPNVLVTSCQSPSEIVVDAWQQAGRVDVIVSNDAFPAIHTSVESADVNDLYRTLEVLVHFPFKIMHAAIPRLKHQKYGRIVFITSCRTDLPMDGGAIPDIARAGVNALVKSLSIELAPFEIPVNAVAPNYLYSETYYPRARFFDDAEGRQHVIDSVPIQRLGEPEEIGELVLYLASMKGTFQTGSIITFAGGWPSAPRRS